MDDDDDTIDDFDSPLLPAAKARATQHIAFGKENNHDVKANTFAQFACASTKRIPSLQLHTSASDMAAPSQLTESIQAAHAGPPLKRARVIEDTPEGKEVGVQSHMGARLHSMNLCHVCTTHISTHRTCSSQT